MMDTIRQKINHIFSIIQDKAVLIYTIVILCFLPFYTANAYYGLTLAKFRCMMYATLMIGVVYLLCNIANFHKITFSNWKYGDILYLLFLLAGGISVQFSAYGMDAFTGVAGRRNGLFLYLIYGVAMLVIIQNQRLYCMSLYAMELMAIFLCGIGISNHFGQDPLHFFWDLVEEQQNFFSSTLGHIDTYGVYVGMMFAFSAVSFLLEKKRLLSIFHGITTVVTMCGIITNRADGAYIAVIVFFLFAWILMEDGQMLLKYNLIAFFFFVIAKVLGILQGTVSTVKPVDGISQLVMLTNLPNYGMAVAGCISVLLVIGNIIHSYRKSVTRNRQGKIEVKEEVSTESVESKQYNRLLALKWLRRILILLLELSIILFVLFFVITNVHPDGELEQPLWDKLRITEEWGNYRGYIWLKTVQYFKDLPFFQQLFGTGPDTTYQIYQQICTESFLTDYGSYFDNAHNEYLQMLLTHGIVGAVSYVSWIGFSIVQCLKKGKDNGAFYAIAFTVLAYAGMAVVGINMVQCMGIVVVLLGLGRCQVVERLDTKRRLCKNGKRC